MAIAADMCVYTNTNFVKDSLALDVSSVAPSSQQR